MKHYWVIATSIFTLFLFSCQDGKSTYDNTEVSIPTVEAKTISITTSLLDDIIDSGGTTKYYPIEQQSYSYTSTFFKYDKESETYIRANISEQEECNLSESCEYYDFSIASYSPTAECTGSECSIGNVCFIVYNSETLLFSARWDEGVTPPNLIPQNCTIEDNGNTYFDCAVQPEGTEHSLVLSDAFIQFSIEEQSPFEVCFN